jgi:hypothetical protein
MRNRLRPRGLGVVAALVLVAAPLVVATAAFGADPGVQSTATVANGAELRQQWAIGNNTLITLTADIDLGRDGNGNDICEGGEPVREDGGGIVIDGQGRYGITQTCKEQRVLRDDSGGETVTLQGLTHFTGGEAYGNGGGLRNDGPVDVVDSDVSGNEANNTCLDLEAGAQVVICETGNGGGIFAGVAVGPYLDVNGYDIHLTNSNVSDNSATDSGGGLYTVGALTTNNSQLTGNTAGGWVEGSGMGGGAYADDSVDSTNTSWTDNEARCNRFSAPVEPIAEADPGICQAVSSGGGFFTWGSATVSGSTFTDNHAYDSGGGFLASDATVDASTFTGNQAGGESTLGAGGVGASSIPGNAGNIVSAADAVGSAFCSCAGGGFAVGADIGTNAAAVAEGGAQVTGSTFLGNGAGCDAYCLGGGGGFYAGGGATVSGSTFGDGSDSGSNAAGCFEICGAMGGGFYSGGNTDVDTSTFTFNGVGCVGGCDALGGGFFGGNGMIIDAIPNAASLPSGVKAALAGDGSTTVAQSTFTANEAGCYSVECGGSGGGFYSGGAPTIDVTASTFSANDALYDGGAISVNGGTILNSVICTADCGGTDATITNSTITGNFSGFPAAISVAQGSDTLTLVNDTIDSNTVVLRDLQTCADLCSNATARAQTCQCYAANVIASDLTSFGTDITHPLVEQGAEPVATFDDVENCWVEDVTSEGYNFSDDDSCQFTDSTDDVADGNDPMLGALASNGGPTQTMLPQPGSPLIDAIQPVSECQVDVDQRGVSRPQIKGCDTGAVEVLGASLRVDKVVTGTAGNPVPANGYTFSVNCTDGTHTSVSVADATAGGSSETVDDILPGAVCTVTEAPLSYSNPNVVGQPVVSYDPAVGSPLGEGDTEVVTVTNDFEGINLLGIAVNLTPRFTG